MSTEYGSALIIGHRGASALAPENTLAAFARALADGADGIEFDVRLARDGVPVVIHDATLRHTGGPTTHVANLTSSRLAAVDVGSWFNRKYPQLARLQYSRQRLPSLDQVLQLFAEQARPHSLMYLEMKTVRSRRANEELARAVVRELESHGLKQRAVVIGFNLFAVAKVKEVDPSLRTGALFGPRQRTTRSIRKMIDATLFVGAQEILFQRLLARPRALAAAREKGLLPVVWTVDDPKWMRQHSGLGIHAIITNHPARMAKASS